MTPLTKSECDTWSRQSEDVRRAQVSAWACERVAHLFAAWIDTDAPELRIDASREWNHALGTHLGATSIELFHAAPDAVIFSAYFNEQLAAALATALNNIASAIRDSTHVRCIDALIDLAARSAVVSRRAIEVLHQPD